MKLKVAAALVAFAASSGAFAHPLGNFSINRWAAIDPTPGRLRIRYAVDLAEIPTFQEIGDRALPEGEAAVLAARYVTGLHLNLGGTELPLVVRETSAKTAPGAGGLRTMRLDVTYEAAIGGIPGGGTSIAFRDDNFGGRAGWREVVAWSAPGMALVEATVPGRDRSARLTSYPQDLIQAPPQVDRAEATLVGGSAAVAAIAAGRAAPLPDLEIGGATAKAQDRFAALIGPAAGGSAGLMLAAFAAALFWGGAHALSPGHGKTVVGAYLVGQRGAARHAIALGLIVTITHTAGVFALGGLTLVLSRYFVPESLYPWLGFASGLIVTAMGVGLLARRFGYGHGHGHHHGHDHDHAVPERLSWRGLLALGISGGIVPCPSAIVVLLSAIAFHRVLFGMALIAAFSLGLAAVLVAVGLTMVYARSVFDRFDGGGRVTQRLGRISAVAIALLGIGVAWKSVPPPIAALFASPEHAISGTVAGILGLGLLFGLRHATEADHIAAVSAIVSERAGWRAAVRTGALWGTGHTVSIVAAGLLVLGLNVVIPNPVARVLELGVAVMIIVLGGRALALALRNRTDAHIHLHAHGDAAHRHLHFHEPEHEHVPGPSNSAHVHVVRRPGLKPLAVGMMHGLAGSAALTLLVLAQIRSPLLGLIYLLVFGIGSIGGMALMSVAISVPFAATAARPGLNRAIRVAAGFLSLAFGLFYAWSQLGAA